MDHRPVTHVPHPDLLVHLTHEDPLTHCRLRCELWGRTGDAVVVDVEVRLEVLAARLRDGVDGGDEQRAVLPPGGAAARVLHVRRHVGVAAERVRVLGRDAAAGRQPPVQRATYDHHVTRLTRRSERLRRTEHLYDQTQPLVNVSLNETGSADVWATDHSGDSSSTQTPPESCVLLCCGVLRTVAESCVNKSSAVAEMGGRLATWA